MSITFKKISVFFALFLLVISAYMLPTSKGGVYNKHKNTSYGIASWYGPGFHGRRTANGEVFNQYDLTAAHKTLPFNTKVLVTNTKNNKSVIVRINDRGPFIEGRVIDLSCESAKKIDTKNIGIAYVSLQLINDYTQ